MPHPPDPHPSKCKHHRSLGPFAKPDHSPSALRESVGQLTYRPDHLVRSLVLQLLHPHGRVRSHFHQVSLRPTVPSAFQHLQESSIPAKLPVGRDPVESHRTARPKPQRDLRLGLEHDLRRNSRLLPPIALRRPALRQVQPVSHSAVPAGVTPKRNTPTWQFSFFPNRRHHCRATPTLSLPRFANPELPITPTAPSGHCRAAGTNSSVKTTWISCCTASAPRTNRQKPLPGQHHRLRELRFNPHSPPNSKAIGSTLLRPSA